MHVRKRHFWEVRFDYDPPVIELLKRRVPGVRWNPHRRAWIVDEDLGGRLLEALSEMSRLIVARSPVCRSRIEVAVRSSMPRAASVTAKASP